MRAGAVAAMLLKERFPSSSLLVLEAEKREGGLLRSGRVGGFTFDVGGSHVIFSRNRALERARRKPKIIVS